MSIVVSITGMKAYAEKVPEENFLKGTFPKEVSALSEEEKFSVENLRRKKIIMQVSRFDCNINKNRKTVKEKRRRAY